MALTSMKLSKKEAKAETVSSESKGPRFPFGLEIRLGDKELKKLGFDDFLPEAGEEFIVVGVGPVTSTHQNESQGGANRSMEIQLQKLEIGPVDADDEKSVASAIDDAIDEANRSA